jgi:Ni/Fe-hydrogenase subunit HybB-like protein
MISRAIAREVRSYPRFIKILMVLVGLSALGAMVRFVYGLGITTNLNDTYPWGLWVSFDVTTAIPLAAGAFTVGVVAHVFNIRKLEPLVRPAIVTGFLGYSLVCVALLLDLGQPQRAWHTLIYWNVHSPMFEVSVCLMAYLTVLCLEFLQPVAEKFGWHVPMRLLRSLEVPFAVAAAAISTLHQSSLGTYFLIAVDKLHNLWYNPLLPLLFWISALFTGLSIVIVEAIMVHRHMDQPDESELLETLASILPWLLAIYLAVKTYALIFLSQRPLFDRPLLSIFFGAEVILGVIVPLALFLREENRADHRKQLLGASLIIIGLVLNRFNVSMFGMIQRNQEVYYPSFIESIVTIGILAAHVLFFFLIARHFPIFQHHPETVDFSIPDRFRKIKEARGH